MNMSGNGSIRLPPVWCGAICRNAMNEICVERCAPKLDCSGFDEKPNLKLADMPRFPSEETVRMTKEERFTSVTIYLSKVIDHLQGTEDGEIFIGNVRRSSSRTASGKAPANQQIKSVLHGFKEAIALHTTGEDDLDGPTPPDKQT